MTNEHSDAIIEASMGWYSVRGALKGEVLVSNKDVAHFVAADTKAALDEMGGAAMVAFLNSSAVVRRLSSGLITIRVLEELYLNETGRVLRRWHDSGLSDPKKIKPGGLRCDNFVLFNNNNAIAIIETWANTSGFRYHLQSAGNVAKRVAAKLACNEAVREGWLLWVDFGGHNVLVHRAHRSSWFEQDEFAFRKTLRQMVKTAAWRGEPPRV